MIFDTLDNLELYAPLLPEMQTIIEVMDRGDVYDGKAGTYKTPNPKVSYEILEYLTDRDGKDYQSKKKESEVDIVLEGGELVSTTWREYVKSAPYDKEKDLTIVEGEPLSVVRAETGRFLLFFPGEPHKCGVPLGEVAKVKKVIFHVTEK